MSRHTTILALVAAIVLLVGAVDIQAVSSMKSEVGQKLMATIQNGIPFEGAATSLDGSDVWPGILFIRMGDAEGTFDGHIEWNSLDHVNYVEGSITETGSFVEVNFKGVKPLVQGSAAAGVDYHMVATIENGEVVLHGKWVHGEHRGPCNLTAKPSMAGQQSALLGGKSIDELLGDQPAQQQQAQQSTGPEIFYSDAVIDWKIEGMLYADGSRRVKLTCNWAREALHKGRSMGEIFFLVSDEPNSPVLGFTHRHPDWKNVISEVTQLDIYVFRNDQFSIPVRANPDIGWVFSTKPSGRLVRAMIDHVYSDDIEVSFQTSKEIVPAYLSMRGIETAWEAAKILLRGEQPPPLHELMESLD